MNMLIIKVCVTSITWLMLYFGCLKDPYFKLTRFWKPSHSLLLLCIISFCWGYFVGVMVDVVRAHIQ
jgi:hypothetical protein